MRLALGFCGQFAKATFSSLSVKKVGLHIEVRRCFCVVAVKDADAFSPFGL